MNNWKKTFAIIWTGQFFSILSSSIVGFACILWLSLETGSAEVLAIAAISSLLPQTVLGFFSGVFVDRWNRKKVMIISDMFIAFCSLLLAGLFYMGEIKPGYIYALLALRSVGSSFHVPAMQASVPLLAPSSELVRISGINQIIYSVSNIAGPALGALFITVFDMTYVLLFDVLGASIACTSLLFVVIPNPEKTEHKQAPNLFREIREGLQEIIKSRGLTWLFVFSIISMFFLMPISVMFPLMTLQHFAGNTFQVSLVEIVWGMGMMLGGFILGIKQIKYNKVAVINCMYVILGLSFLLSGVLPPSGFVFFVILTVLGGISGSVFHAMFTAVIQLNVAPQALGRVFSMFGSLSMIPSLIGLSAIGIIADVIGIPKSFIISGAVIITAGVASFFVPPLMKIGQSKESENKKSLNTE
ncbi:MAG: MFS transporter [Prevotellaceae bacterium]|jgi:DHA3 family macrolide efflux protein-like MFS transporter|nr:MFS transporter [Prevotellaceae bacterium]